MAAISADDMFKRIVLNENVRFFIQISLKFVPTGPIDNQSALVQVMAWRRTGWYIRSVVALGRHYIHFRSMDAFINTFLTIIDEKIKTA